MAFDTAKLLFNIWDGNNFLYTFNFMGWERYGMTEHVAAF
jgi:hypothetical protein